MKRIGLTSRVHVIKDFDERRDSIDQRWHELVLNLGCIPVTLPNIDPLNAKLLVKNFDLDGIILTGGNSLQILDPNNTEVAPERDEFEKAIISFSLECKIPVLGVCRGMQLINVYFGGTLKKVSEHVGVEHELKSLNKDFDFPAKVNSFHEWCIPKSNLANTLEPLAYDASRNIEAFKHRNLNIYGIMWHPERALPLSTKETIFFKNIFL